MGKVSNLTPFPLEPGCDHYSFLDPAVKDLVHCLVSILRDTLHTPELEALFDEADAMPS